MGSFIQFNELFQKINPSELIKDAVLFTGDKAIELNQEQLYVQSEDSEGNKLKSYADENYANYKQTLNPFLPLGSPDLKETGSFYDKTYAEVTGETITINSTDFKNDSLVKKYGKIHGLNKENLIIYGNDYVRPLILENISLATGLKIVGNKSNNKNIVPF